MFFTTGALGAVGLGLSVGGGMVTSDVEGLAAKTQPGINVSAMACFPFWDIIGPGVTLSLGNAWPSDLSGGWDYRGYWEAGVSAYLMFQLPVVTIGDAGVVRAGGRAGMTASLSTYQYTTLTFFSPSIDLAPFASFTPRALPAWSFSLALPARYILRRDMAWSWSVGIEAGVIYAPRKGK